MSDDNSKHVALLAIGLVAYKVVFVPDLVPNRLRAFVAECALPSFQRKEMDSGAVYIGKCIVRDGVAGQIRVNRNDPGTKPALFNTFFGRRENIPDQVLTFGFSLASTCYLVGSVSDDIALRTLDVKLFGQDRICGVTATGAEIFKALVAAGMRLEAALPALQQHIQHEGVSDLADEIERLQHWRAYQ